MKLGRCFEFLNNYYGFLQGTNQYSFTKVLCGSDKLCNQENSKLRALISNNFGRRKNDPVKDRKVISEYVRLCGYKHGQVGGGHGQTSQNGNSGMTLEEIAKQLGTSKTNLTRALSIERNLTDSMKELLDTGEITKTFASDYLVCKGF